MTRAPENLLAVRALLLSHLAGLSADAVGIVGDPRHRGGYHCGSDRVVPDDYSVVESPRDRAGLTIDASAVDVGLFEVRVRSQVHNLRTFSIWCVEQCQAGAPDTLDIREVIYSPDGTTVRRWDRLRRRSSGDSSHRTHTHLSYFRDATKAGRDLTPLYRRYLTTIGLLEDDMPLTPADLDAIARRVWTWDLHDGPGVDMAYRIVNRTDATVTQLAGKDPTNAIVAGVLAKLTPEAIAAAIPPTIAQQVIDELAARLAH